MKKLFALLLAVMLIVSITPTVYAADDVPANQIENTTILTTEVPPASYTMNIPADQIIKFNNTSTDIGNVTITNSQYFATGKNLAVKIEHSGKFTAENVTTSIPYTLKARHYSASGNNSENGSAELTSGSVLTFAGLASGKVSETASMEMNIQGSTTSSVDGLTVDITSADWGKALAGAYSSSIVFTAEVVVE